MKAICLLVLVLAIGCTKKPADCGSTTGILYPTGSIDDGYAAKAELATQVGNAITDACRADHWSQDAIDCMAGQRGTGRDITSVLEDCAPKVGASYAKLDKRLSDLSVDAMMKQLDRARTQRAAISGAQ